MTYISLWWIYAIFLPSLGCKNFLSPSQSAFFKLEIFPHNSFMHWILHKASGGYKAIFEPSHRQICASFRVDWTLMKLSNAWCLQKILDPFESLESFCNIVIKLHQIQLLKFISLKFCKNKCISEGVLTMIKKLKSFYKNKLEIRIKWKHCSFLIRNLNPFQKIFLIHEKCF